MKSKENILLKLSSHLFWNCDVNKLEYKKNEKLVIERIAEYGLEKDEIIMWRIYNYNKIKKIIKNMTHLPYLRILYYSCVLGIKENKFKCYKNKSYQWNY